MPFETCFSYFQGLYFLQSRAANANCTVSTGRTILTSGEKVRAPSTSAHYGLETQLVLQPYPWAGPLDRSRCLSILQPGQNGSLSQMRGAWLLGNVGMCVCASVLHYQQQLIVCIPGICEGMSW